MDGACAEYVCDDVGRWEEIRWEEIRWEEIRREEIRREEIREDEGSATMTMKQIREDEGPARMKQTLPSNVPGRACYRIFLTLTMRHPTRVCLVQWPPAMA